ncbi:MAG: 4-hydroxy-tetrahydrodipicolinate reductase [Ruminococcaceae bacterium]|nr:4-hydroxy-tetrahydrodipicolinate reductase [Oscillospiraceae bacterium]
MKIIVNGAGGRMGKTLCDLIEKSEKHTLVAAVSMEFETDGEKGIYKSLEEFAGDCDILIDFSNHSATYDVTSYALKRALPVVIATTGQNEQELEMIKSAAAEVPVFYSQNMSLGVAILSCLAKIAAKALPDCDIEIIEKHHNQKLDVPSGTALLLADSIRSVRNECEYNVGRHEYGKRTKNEIGIHSLRMGGEVGTHEIIFAMGSQVITLKHEAENRSLFAEGALSAAEYLVSQDAGFYNMDNILG